MQGIVAKSAPFILPSQFMPIGWTINFTDNFNFNDDTSMHWIFREYGHIFAWYQLPIKRFIWRVNARMSSFNHYYPNQKMSTTPLHSASLQVQCNCGNARQVTHYLTLYNTNKVIIYSEYDGSKLLLIRLITAEILFQIKYHQRLMINRCLFLKPVWDLFSKSNLNEVASMKPNVQNKRFKSKWLPNIWQMLKIF